jgi:hypothetical protein
MPCVKLDMPVMDATNPRQWAATQGQRRAKPDVKSELCIHELRSWPLFLM